MILLLFIQYETQEEPCKYGFEEVELHYVH